MRRRLDALLGKVTMYKLVLALLIALAVESLVLSFAGIVAFSPLELVVTYAVAIATTMVSSWIFALIFRTKAHLESAAITGILLYFVLIPTLEALGLLAVAVAGVVASASKYLIAVRGRHIVNPAAFGALVVTVLGMTFSGWWVSNAFFLPLVAVGAFLILYKTRRLAMGALFIVTVAVIVTVRSISTGGSPTEALGFAFLSTATVFFAGFMLSEPLTLPPRRWQQLALAVVVGALFSIPFSLGPVFSSPQLALVLGNVLAFVVGQRRGIPLTFLGRKQLTPTSWEFSFEPRKPVRFEPGQYLELSLPHAKADVRGQRRIFSISSAPAAGGPVTVGVKVSERSSSFKRALLELPEGATARATGVSGDFLLPKDASVPLLLVAGGIGVTPFASQLAHSGAGRDVVLVYSVSDAEELAYRDVLEQSGARVIVIAPAAPVDLPSSWNYAGPARLTRDSLLRFVPDAATRRAFVSGPPALVDDARAILRSAGVKRVSTDYFSGY